MTSDARRLPLWCRLFGHRWTHIMNPNRGVNDPVLKSVCARCGLTPMQAAELIEEAKDA